jgi:GGDEF domain-containing protein
VARFGGDEFAVLLPDASADEALGIADRITLTSCRAEPVRR